MMSLCPVARDSVHFRNSILCIFWTVSILNKNEVFK